MRDCRREETKKKNSQIKENVGPHLLDLQDPSKWALESGASMDQTGCPEHPIKAWLDTDMENLKAKSTPQTHCCCP